MNQFFHDLGFNKRPTQGLAYETDVWDLQWNELKIHLTFADIEHSQITIHAHGFLGDKSYGHDKTITYEIIDNTPSAITSTLYEIFASYGKLMLQWNLRRLLGTEDERSK